MRPPVHAVWILFFIASTYEVFSQAGSERFQAGVTVYPQTVERGFSDFHISDCAKFGTRKSNPDNNEGRLRVNFSEHARLQKTVGLFLRFQSAAVFSDNRFYGLIELPVTISLHELNFQLLGGSGYYIVNRYRKRFSLGVDLRGGVFYKRLPNISLDTIGGYRSYVEFGKLQIDSRYRFRAEFFGAGIGLGVHAAYALNAYSGISFNAGLLTTAYFPQLELKNVQGDDEEDNTTPFKKISYKPDLSATKFYPEPSVRTSGVTMAIAYVVYF